MVVEKVPTGDITIGAGITINKTTNGVTAGCTEERTDGTTISSKTTDGQRQAGQ